MVPSPNSIPPEQENAAGGDYAFWRRVRQLFGAVVAVCDDVGCACLAERYSFVSAQPAAGEQAPCPSCGEPGCMPHFHLLAKLAPLTRALGRAGYYDLAMFTVELALACEATLDLRLARAYLAVVLGETEQASQIYHDVLKTRGRLPREVLEQLAELTVSHASEEDILSLYDQLAPYGDATPSA